MLKKILGWLERVYVDITELPEDKIETKKETLEILLIVATLLIAFNIKVGDASYNLGETAGWIVPLFVAMSIFHYGALTNRVYDRTPKKRFALFVSKIFVSLLLSAIIGLGIGITLASFGPVAIVIALMYYVVFGALIYQLI